jgi:hypothetical protein
MQSVQTKKRLKRLELEYFPKRQPYILEFHMPDLIFCAGFGATYEGRLDSAPSILLQEYRRLMTRGENPD